MITSLPPELYPLILIKTSPRAIIQLSQTSTYWAGIGNNEDIWEAKMIQDYPQYVNYRPPDVSYKTAYLELLRHQAKVFPLHYNSKIITQVWVSKGITSLALFDKICRLIDENIGSDVEGLMLIVIRQKTWDYCYLRRDWPSDSLNEFLWEDVTGFKIVQE